MEGRVIYVPKGFQQAGLARSQNGDDQQLKEWAPQTLPTLQDICAAPRQWSAVVLPGLRHAEGASGHSLACSRRGLAAGCARVRYLAVSLSVYSTTKVLISWRTLPSAAMIS
jgi:hypothetical protein